MTPDKWREMWDLSDRPALSPPSRICPGLWQYGSYVLKMSELIELLADPLTTMGLSAQELFEEMLMEENAQAEARRRSD